MDHRPVRHLSDDSLTVALAHKHRVRQVARLDSPDRHLGARVNKIKISDFVNVNVFSTAASDTF